MDADDSALVYFFTVTDEQPPAFLQVKQGISQCLAGAVCDEYAVDALPVVTCLYRAVM